MLGIESRMQTRGRIQAFKAFMVKSNTISRMRKFCYYRLVKSTNNEATQEFTLPLGQIRIPIDYKIVLIQALLGFRIQWGVPDTQYWGT